jgi:hypothetical protein
MIEPAETRYVHFRMLTWEGDVQELRDFGIGDLILFVASDGTVTCKQPRGHKIRLRPGDKVLLLDEPDAGGMSPLWFIGDDGWAGKLFRVRRK